MNRDSYDLMQKKWELDVMLTISMWSEYLVDLLGQ